MKWFYLVRREGKILPVNPRRLPPRPPDANPPGDDPFTPWYETKDHFDEDHFHVLAENLEEALRKAELLQKG